MNKDVIRIVNYKLIRGGGSNRLYLIRNNYSKNKSIGKISRNR